MRIIKNEWFNRKPTLVYAFLRRYFSCIAKSVQAQKTHFLKYTSKKEKEEDKDGEHMKKNIPHIQLQTLGSTPKEGCIKNYKNMEIGKLLKYMLDKIKHGEIKKKECKNKIEEIVKHIFENEIIINSVNFLSFNMLLTVINKSEMKISNKLLGHIVKLLHKNIITDKKDVNNTNSSWINIVNLLSGISKNNKHILYLIGKKIDNNSIGKKDNVSTSSSFVHKFVQRISKLPCDYSIREISLLLHSCYNLNIRNAVLFRVLFEVLLRKEQQYNILDIHIFVYAVYKLQLYDYTVFLEKLKKDILKNVSSFSDGQLVNLLLAYTFFFLKNKNKTSLLLQCDVFISNIFKICMERMSQFSNREFCNLLNFITQNNIYLHDKQRHYLFRVLSDLLEHERYESKLTLNLMIDVDIFTIVNFVYKYYNYNNDPMRLSDSAVNNLDNTIIHLVNKKKFKQNLLIYILHYYKARLTTPVTAKMLKQVLQSIDLNTVELKMKVILLTSIERFYSLLEKKIVEENFILKYYYHLLNSVYKDVCKYLTNGEITNMRKNRKETLSTTDMKEILKLIKKRGNNCEYTTEHASYIHLNRNIQNNMANLQEMLLNKLNEHIVKNKIVELFPLTLMNLSTNSHIFRKVEFILGSLLNSFNDNFSGNKKGIMTSERQSACVDANTGAGTETYPISNMSNNTTRNTRIYDGVKTGNVCEGVEMPLNLVHSLNLCNECIFVRRENITKFLKSKNVILNYVDCTSESRRNGQNYFNLYVHMLLFDVNRQLPFFIQNLLVKIYDQLRNKNFNYEQNMLNVIDIYSSIIKVDSIYYHVYINGIYKLIFSKLFNYYKKLGSKYLSLLFYSNVIHLYLHIHPKVTYRSHVILSIRVLSRLYHYFLNSLDEDTYNLLKSNFNELEEYYRRDKKSFQLFPLWSLNEVIYIYRTLYFFNFANMYKYMNIYELKCFYAFCKILHFYIFNVKNFSICEFTQTNKGTSNVHSSVVNCLNDLFKKSNKVNILCEQVVFPLFIIDILVCKN
ncbi:conserved Plasmodium protein, unknown function [Plasmodium ovale curtisi]|uniref:Uncharacterized protein n=1 Tax=Plasmodium ovale curtisi TaxID=864141 RepID=A0A1A8WHR0_PLAOA|nr:conserved Plasmodium protein, unknown function [Plasmodium ovale curtisi]